MNCFSHQDSPAIGICKACQKAVCASCTIDTGRGLACSDDCREEVLALNLMTDRGKRIYGIGQSSRLPPTGVLLFAFFGLIFSADSLYRYLSQGSFNLISISMDIGFLAFAAVSYMRTRNLNLNC